MPPEALPPDEQIRDVTNTGNPARDTTVTDTPHSGQTITQGELQVANPNTTVNPNTEPRIPDTAVTPDDTSPNAPNPPGRNGAQPTIPNRLRRRAEVQSDYPN